MKANAPPHVRVPQHCIQLNEHAASKLSRAVACHRLTSISFPNGTGPRLGTNKAVPIVPTPINGVHKTGQLLKAFSIKPDKNRRRQACGTQQHNMGQTRWSTTNQTPIVVGLAMSTAITLST